MDYRVKLWDGRISTPTDKDRAERIAEDMWRETGSATQVIDADDNVVCEFES